MNWLLNSKSLAANGLRHVLAGVGGQYRPALFTYDVLNDAIDRAARQPEDAPKDPSFFKRLIMDLQG